MGAAERTGRGGRIEPGDRGETRGPEGGGKRGIGALLLHYLDDLDSKMEAMRVVGEKDPHADGFFTPWSQSLERTVLRKQRYLDPRESVPAPAPPPANTVTQLAPVASSPFGNKLQTALHEEGK